MKLSLFLYFFFQLVLVGFVYNSYTLGKVGLNDGIKAILCTKYKYLKIL